MKFCWNCGHENESDSLFCEECGSDLQEGISPGEELKKDNKEPSTELQESKETNQSIVNSTSTQPPIPKEPMTKKKKIGLITGGVGIVLLVGLYSYGNYYFSYEQQVNRMVETIKTKDPDKWVELMISSDPSYKLTSDNLKKMTDYYKDDQQKEKFSNLVGSIGKSSQGPSDFNIKPNGKSFVFFNKYALELEPVYLTIEAQQPGVSVEIDGKKQGDVKEKELKVGPLTPGKYDIKGTLKNVSTDSKADLVRFQNDDFETNSHMKLDLHKVSFVVKSNVEDAEVLVDNKKIATIKDGSAEVKDIVWHQGLAVQVKKKFDKQVVESEIRKIESEEFLASQFEKESYGSEMMLEIKGIKSKDDVQSFLYGLYSDVSSYTSEYSDLDGMEKSDLAKYFQNGEDNADYQDFLKFITDVRSSSEKSSVQGEPKVEKMTMIGKDRYQVQYLIKYRTVYKSYKMDDVVQVFRYTKGTMVYNQEEERFEIVDLGGKENFEVVDNGGVS